MFMLDEMTPWNTSKFAINHTKQNPKMIFYFSFHTIQLFFPGLCQHSTYQGIQYRKNKVVRNERWQRQLWVFIFKKYGKFWSVSLGHFIKHKLLFSEEWFMIFWTRQFIVISTHCKNFQKKKIGFDTFYYQIKKFIF